MKIDIAGNCQAGALRKLMSEMAGLPIRRIFPKRKEQYDADADVIFAQSQYKDTIKGNVLLFPRIVTPGFYPDVVFAFGPNRKFKSPLGNFGSRIIIKAWCEGLSAEDTCSLFNRHTFETLGFFDYLSIGMSEFAAEGRTTDFPLEELMQRWMAAGWFMHTLNHPRGRVLTDIAEILLSKANLSWKSVAGDADRYAAGMGWPLYPELAERVGLEGSYAFRMRAEDGGKTLDLREFVEMSFANFGRRSTPREPLPACLGTMPMGTLRDLVPSSKPRKHPYVGLAERQFWREAVRGDVDPVTSHFMIQKSERVATAGSCFAQHIARALKAKGLNYFVAERDPGQGGANYGVFSARYGNLYTARQLVQLFDRAYGRFTPVDVSWRRRDRFIDPFRPEIEPDGFESQAALLDSRKVHFEAVRRMFEELDVFVFTLGLTEAWRRKSDGALFPLAPGVSGGVFNPELHEFVNFTVFDVIADLRDFLQRLGSVNKRARVIFTVSPVPLAATYEPRHVLVSTVYSKSVLRVAAEEVARDRADVVYFPSYEIVTGSFNRGRYFGDDLRAITPEGVDHVMRVFLKHFAADPNIEALVRNAMEVVCEEEKLLEIE